VAKNVQRFIDLGWKQMEKGEVKKKSSQSTEIMSLFFYHIYRKMVKEEYRRYFQKTGQYRQDDN
jgi:hypothetical protein